MADLLDLIKRLAAIAFIVSSIWAWAWALGYRQFSHCCVIFVLFREQ